MFETTESVKLPVSDKDAEAGNLNWRIARIPKNKPFLLVSISCSCNQELSVSTFLLRSLHEVLFYGNRQHNKIEKIQFMEPAETINGGWRLHDIVSIRTGTVRADEDQAEIEEREEYHTAEGHCFTFSDLADDDSARASEFTIAYSAANGQRR